ncbi:MAG: hypothetical protein ACRC3Y_11400 [Romboutsia sp.]|uniref:DNA polymerase III subunit beta family protein n=1 Tax=Romboutsia sp. TaxID=1965302 RepID=UPI003F35FA27
MLRVNGAMKNEILRGEKIGEYVVVKSEGLKAIVSAKSKDGNMEFLTQIDLKEESTETYIFNKKAIAALKCDESEFEVSKTKDEIKLKCSSFKAVFKEPTEVDLSTMNAKCENLIKLDITKAKKVMYATCVNESKPILQGICFRTTEESMMDIVAMDGYRIAKTKVEFEVLRSDTPIEEFVINKSNLAKIIGLTEGQVGVSVFKDKVSFFFGKSIIVVKKMNDKYIDYSKMLNIELANTTDIVKEDIVNVLNRFSMISENRKVNLSIKRDNITILSKDTTSLLEDSIMCESTKDIDMAFNQKYLNEFFEFIDEEDITMEYEAPNKPIKITDGVTENLLLPVASDK